METQFCYQLEEVFNSNGFPLTPMQIEQLAVYRSELERWNSHINLTALRDDAEIIHKHFLDSVSVLEHCAIEDGHTVIDIGTGAGFPGIVLKIYIPNVHLTLVEASQKKVAFLKYLIYQLGLDPSIQVLAERAETCAESDAFVNTFDWVLTRYVASLVKSATYCLPLLNATGKWIAYKSSEKDVEIRQSRDVLKELGGEIEGMYNSRVAQLNRCYIVIRRIDGGI